MTLLSLATKSLAKWAQYWTSTGKDPSADVAGWENYVKVAGQNWFPKIDIVMVVIPPLHFGNIRRGRGMSHSSEAS